MTRRLMTTLALAAAIPAMAAAQGGMMSGGAMAGATGMGGGLTVADDGSILLVQAVAAADASDTWSREVVSIAPDGSERWHAELDSGWMAQIATQGELVVVTLSDGGFAGDGSGGDSGWQGGMGAGAAGNGDITVLALDLATGDELWHATLDGGMGGTVRFAPDGARIYVTTAAHSGTRDGSGSMHQGDAAGATMDMSVTLTALDPASGAVLWTHDVESGSGSGGMGGGGMGGGGMMGIASSR